VERTLRVVSIFWWWLGFEEAAEITPRVSDTQRMYQRNNNISLLVYLIRISIITGLGCYSIHERYEVSTTTSTTSYVVLTPVASLASSSLLDYY